MGCSTLVGTAYRMEPGTVACPRPALPPTASTPRHVAPMPLPFFTLTCQHHGAATAQHDARSQRGTAQSGRPICARRRPTWHAPPVAPPPAEFRSPAKSLHSPFPPSSRATSSATVTPIQWGSASYRSSSYRALAAQQALAAQVRAAWLGGPAMRAAHQPSPHVLCQASKLARKGTTLHTGLMLC